MIKVENLTKHFGDFTALSNISCTIKDGSIYGMVGSNGAGKSTFLRILSGVYNIDGGNVTIDGQSVWENPAVKKRIAYVPDELYFLNNGGVTMDRMAQMYASLYKSFDKNRYKELVGQFGLDPRKPINQFSKGMRRQASVALAISTKPDYIFFDETFDGLDPVVRHFVKGIICNDVIERKASAIITSHSLRELEDTCDQLALLHKGGIVVESEIQNLKTAQFKVQIALNTEYDKSLFDGIEILHFAKHGSVTNMIVRGDREQVNARLKQLSPSVLDILPLSLEEVFTYEMEALGYSFNIEQENVI